ncbi:MAG TPA: hypothetical protein VJM11_07960 [Nevskiaceae bacterium]|nr:hypothetical protein [Nevskiaceae bacterium]
MTTELSKALRRAIEVDGRPYVVTIDEAGLKLVAKGRRKGLELLWKDLVSGEAALATALNASLESLPGVPEAPAAVAGKSPRKKKR